MVVLTSGPADQFFLQSTPGEFLEEVLHGDQREYWVKALSLYGETSYDFIASLPQGQKSWLVSAKSLDRDTGILFHISPSDQADELQSTKEELALLKKEYQFFIDTAAHDLDSPLRKMSFMIDKLATKSNDEADAEYFRRLQNGVSDMRRLIDNLTQLANITNETLQISNCHLELLVKQSWGEMPASVRNAHTLAVSALPSIRGDATALKLLFRQLLNNSVRFSKKETSNEIRVSSVFPAGVEKNKRYLKQASQYVQIEFSDKGIGFPATDAEKIFEPFIRLHAKSEYNGDGLGLSIARKIAIKHGGIIYAEGKEKEGSRIVLILPANP